MAARKQPGVDSSSWRSLTRTEGQPEVQSREERLAKLVKDTNAKWVKAGITTADRPIVGTLATMAALRGKKLPTGNTVLDLKLGGGLTKGTSVRIWGPAGTGKSVSTMEMVAGIVQRGGTALWIQSDPGDPQEMAKMFGIMPDNPRLLHQNVMGSGEMTFEVLQSFLTENDMPSDLIDVVVIDSIAGLAPREELEAIKKDGLASSSQGMSLPERMMSRLFRIMHSTKMYDRAVLILISEARVDLGCFNYNTRVMLSDGRQERIGKIVHDPLITSVMCYNENTGEFEAANILKKFHNGPAEKFLRLCFHTEGGGRRGTTMTCTPQHKILCVDETGLESYRSAEDLQLGDKVVRIGEHDGNKSEQGTSPFFRKVAVLTGTQVLPVAASSRGMTRYDLEVEGHHNYIAGGVVVHNSYGSPEKAKGGRATLHGVRLDLRFSAIGGKDGLLKVGSGDKERVVGHRYRIKFMKDGIRHRLQHYEFENDVYYGKGLDNAVGLYQLLVEEEAFTRAGAFYSPNASMKSYLPPGDWKIQGEAKMKDTLRTNAEFCNGCLAYLTALYEAPTQDLPTPDFVDEQLAEAEALLAPFGGQAEDVVEDLLLEEPDESNGIVL